MEQLAKKSQVGSSTGLTLEEIVLAWFITHEKFERAKIVGDMAKGRKEDRPGIQRSLADTLDRLRSKGLIEKKKRRFVLSEAGRKVALDALGIPELPQHQKVTWTWAKKLLRIRALDAPLTPATLQVAGKKDWLEAVLLARYHALPIQGELDSKKLFERLALRVLGDEEAGHVTSVRAFWRMVQGTRVEPAAPPTFPPATVAQAASLEEFAAEVNRLAREALPKNEDRIFISHLWEALRTRERDLDLDEFKRRLVSAHRARLVHLVRADLVPEMPFADVAASKTSDGDISFHFLQVD